MTATRLGGLDAAFLCLDTAEHPMQMGGLALFRAAAPADATRVAGLLARRAARIPRLAERVQMPWLPPGQPYWAADPEFDPARHVRTHALPGGAGRPGLHECVAELAGCPLDRDRPLWRVHVITGLPQTVAVLVVLHHALADGASALMLGLGLLDGNDTSADTGPGHAPGSAWEPGAGEAGRAEPGLPPGWPPGAVRPDHLWQLACQRLGRLPHTLRQAGQTAGDAVVIAAGVLRAARIGQPRSPLLFPQAAAPACATVTLPLAQVRAARRRHGGTANDVLLAVIAGALREWLLARHQAPDDITVRALVPVSRRRALPGSGPDNGGNQLSGYLCDLAVGEADPVRRLAAIRAVMDANKARGARRGPGAIPVLADLVPFPVHRVLTPLLGRAAPLLFDVVVTNVPLPGLRLALDGMPLRELYPIVPLAAGQALAVALLSCHDTVYLTLHANRGAIPGLPRLAAAIPAALDALAPHLATPAAPAGATGPDRGQAPSQAARAPALPVPRARRPGSASSPAPTRH